MKFKDNKNNLKIITVTNTIISLILLLLIIRNIVTVKETRRYDHKCVLNKPCEIEFEISKYKAWNPLFIYIYIKGFSQIDSSIINSFYKKQFNDKDNFLTTAGINDSCKQFLTNFDVQKYISYDGKFLNPSEIANPCGALPMYFPFGYFTRFFYISF